MNETRSVSYLIDALTGEHEEGWPLPVRGLVGEAVLLPLIGEGHPASLTIADVDGDGDMELTNAVMLGMNGPVHHDGSDFWDLSFVSADFPEEYGADIASLVQMSSQPIWADLTGDGVPEYITPRGISPLFGFLGLSKMGGLSAACWGLGWGHRSNVRWLATTDRRLDTSFWLCCG